MKSIPFRRRSAAFTIAALAAGLALAACEGNNAFETPGGGGGGSGGGGGGGGSTDTTRPTVVIEFPTSGETTVAVADSVFVRARVSDNVGLDSVVFTGFSLRGDPNLGTQQAVQRFAIKRVALGAGGLVRDTVLSRYLLATTDTVAESGVMVLVAAYDTAGNVSADTAKLNIGGPRVQIVTPASGATFPGGTQIPVRIEAQDQVDQIRSVRLRASGAFPYDQTITLSTARSSLDTVVVIPIPNVQGNLRLDVTAVSGGNVSGTGRPVDVVITPPGNDTQAPRTTFSVDTELRVEPDDTFRVAVSAVDETRVDSVGVTVLALRRLGAAAETLGVFSARTRAAADTFTFSLAQLPLSGLDTATVSLEVTAYAVDPARNCGAAISINSPQAQPCRAGPQGSRLAELSGRLYTLYVARGATIPYPNPGDVIADLIADSQRVYLSNDTRNRVEVLSVGSGAYGAPVRVGSQPWGLAIGRGRDTLYVANSGGTNISVIPLRESTLEEAQDRRIFTRNERLFSVTYRNDTGVVAEVALHDYSDRPQFIGQASNGLIVYSTRPTASAEDGTVRIYNPRKLREEIFTGYVDRHTAGQGLVVNADSAFLGNATVVVCPRRRLGDTTDPECIVGNAFVVADSLTKLRALPANASGGKWDTRLDLGADVAEVGFGDTTFVAVSGDRNYVGVGEGVRENARIPLFRAGGDSLVLVADVRDLISNASERVIGLGLNFDGSLGVARGSQAYYFNNAARLQGVVASGSPAGGVAQHPDNSGYPGGSFRLSFVSGIDPTGPYVDVIDNFNFFRVKRIYTRDPVVGALAVTPRAPGDPASVALRIYALTSRGVVSLRVTSADLVP